MSSMLDLDALETIKQRQRATWAAGDYSVIGTSLQIVGESLCEAVDVRAGWQVLDVAAGNGNAAEGRESLRDQLIALADGTNRANAGALTIPADYLEVTILN